MKQKLAEMVVQCFVSESMVYRTLGDVEHALEVVDGADTAAVLKTIETFAVECSINKVATSEALAYAVDEAVQVFGGNGYSRDFPVERAYRDARITRIYEGTNEINRLIIATRLLKNSDPLLGQPAEEDVGGSVLQPERQALAQVKQLARTALGSAAQAFGAGVRDEQEVLGARRQRDHRVLRDRERRRPRGETDGTRERARCDRGGRRAGLHQRCHGPGCARRQADRECARRVRLKESISSAPPSHE